VQGVGLQAVPSDWAEIKATVEARRHLNSTLTSSDISSTALTELIESVQQEVSEKATAVIALLTGNSTTAKWVSKLRTSGVGLEPLWEYKDGRQLLVGSRASNSISFRIQVQRAGEVIDEIVSAGITRIDSMSFVASPEKINRARQKAIETAVQDAIEQALVREPEGMSEAKPEAGSVHPPHCALLLLSFLSPLFLAFALRSFRPMFVDCK
jgi:uncharacterized protein YggE